MGNLVEYNDKVKFYKLGLIVGSDERLLSGGGINNKVVRIEVEDDRVRVIASKVE